MRPLNLEHLRTLVAIADTGSFSAAGRRLHLSAAALGLHVAELERRVGGTLVLRHARGVALNAAGRALVERARRLLADAAEAESQVREQLALRSRRLRVATLTCMVLELFPDLPPDGSLDETDGAAAVDFVITGAAASLQMLESEAVDLAIMALPRDALLDRLSVVPMCSVPIVVCSPIAWALPSTAGPRDLRDRPFVGSDGTTTLHALSMEWLSRESGRSPEITVNFDAAILRLVAEGMGFALLPSAPKMMQDLQHRVQVSRTAPALGLSFSFVFRRDSAQAARIEALMASISATAARRWPAHDTSSPFPGPPGGMADLLD